MLHSNLQPQLYFLVKRDSTVRGFVSGSTGVYGDFWESRAKELKSYPDEDQEEMTDYLNQQIFGTSPTGDDLLEDYEMQVAFKEAKAQEIFARAAGKKADKSRSEGGEGEGDEKYDS